MSGDLKLDAKSYGGDKVYDIPKGTMSLVNVVGIAQNPKYWIKDYEENKYTKYADIDMMKIHFDFWLDDNGNFIKKKNSSNFFSFHYGKRDCIGQSLAIKELMIVLSMIFMEYKVIGKNGTSNFEIGTHFGGVVNEPTDTKIRFKKRC